jgi:hypothetical protein
MSFVFEGEGSVEAIAIAVVMCWAMTTPTIDSREGMVEGRRKR